VNRYGATLVAVSLLMTLGACGGNDAATPAASQSPIVPETSTPTPRPSPTPAADPTTAARAKILADYSVYVAFFAKGLRYGGAGYPYEQWMVDPALTAVKNYMGAIKGVRGAKVTGESRLVGSRVAEMDLTAKVPTAVVVACINDGFNATAKDGKVLVRAGGKVSRRDKVKLLKGRWMVYSSQGGGASYACTS
jgi:hypothetical protein